MTSSFLKNSQSYLVLLNVNWIFYQNALNLHFSISTSNGLFFCLGVMVFIFIFHQYEFKVEFCSVHVVLKGNYV